MSSSNSNSNSSLPSVSKSHQRGWLMSSVGSGIRLDSNVKVPTPTFGNLIIRVHASSLNPVDWKVSSLPNSNYFGLNFPSSVGWDYSGEVVAIGDGITEFAVGDEVFGLIPLWSSGAFVEYASVPVTGAIKKPKSVSHTDAATLGIAAISAYGNLKLADLKGKTVFVAGGSGGVGQFAVSFARILGAKTVITSASKDESIKWLTNVAKADAVINYKKENVVEAVRKLTQGRGVDVAFDSTYLESSLLESLAVLTEGGVLNVLSTSVDAPESIQKLAEPKKIKLIYHDMGRFNLYRKDEFHTLKPLMEDSVKWLEEGKLKVFVSEIIQFEDIANGLKRLEEGKFNGGKLVAKHIN